VLSIVQVAASTSLLLIISVHAVLQDCGQDPRKGKIKPMSESVAQLDNGTDEIVADHKVKRKFFILADGSRKIENLGENYLEVLN